MRTFLAALAALLLVGRADTLMKDKLRLGMTVTEVEAVARQSEMKLTSSFVRDGFALYSYEGAHAAGLNAFMGVDVAFDRAGKVMAYGTRGTVYAGDPVSVLVAPLPGLYAPAPIYEPPPLPTYTPPPPPPRPLNCTSRRVGATIQTSCF